MHDDELKAVFDQQAGGYDQRWAKMAAIPNGLHFLLESLFAELPADARLLCVGAGTGKEIAHLARKFPRWIFTAVEPSGPMLDVCRQRAEEEGFASRCVFHEGYLDSFPSDEKHHAATCFLVSQFILEPHARTEFFRSIADRLLPGGLLASSDLASDVSSDSYETLLRAWMNMMSAGDIPPEGLEQMREAYAKDVAILAPHKVAAMIEAAGFEPPVQFFQAGLIHAWVSKQSLASVT